MTLDTQSLNLNARQIIFKRLSTAQALAYTGPLGEIVIDTTLKLIRVQDGVTPGGTLMITSNVAANLQAQIDSIKSNLDPAALDSLTEIVANVNALLSNNVESQLVNSGFYANLTSTGNLVVPGSLLPKTHLAQDLGSPTQAWRDLYISNATAYFGNAKLTITNNGLQVFNANNQPMPLIGAIKLPDGSLVTSSGNIGGGGNLTITEGQYDDYNVYYNPNSAEFTYSANPGVVRSHLELTNQAAPWDIWAGPEISFVKTDYGTEVDQIDANLAITRGNNQGIYNSILEQEWDDTYGDPDGRASPKGTVWNSDGWNDLTNLDQRTYQTFYNTMNGNLGNNVLPRLFIMKDVANNTYYKIDFTVWGNANNGAPVTYTRQQVDPVDGTDIGNLVTFTKAGYADPFLVFDNISNEVKISRASNQSIFNIVSEQGYNGNSPGDGDGENSPQGTEWNLDGWLDLSDVKQRTYKPFLNILDWNIGERVVGQEFVMHDMANDNYYAIKFTQWTGGSNGGGFAYTRRLINTDFVFVHNTDGNEVDEIAANVAITRGDWGAIYNPYTEQEWDDAVSPGGTEWNFDGNHDLSNVENRVYKTFWEAIQYSGIGYKIEGREAVMRVTSTGDYYTIKFLHWQQGGGGAFSYIRTPIDLTKVNEGIRFADGTVQKTAANDRVKFQGPIGRRIEEYYGYEQVDITQAQEYELTTTMRGNYNNSDFVQINVPNELTAQEINNSTLRNIAISFDNGVTWIPIRKETGGWGQYPTDNWYIQLYTLNGLRISYTDSQPVKLRYWRNGEPQLWFDPEKSPGGDGNFRGAIIDYHAYCDRAGTIIGQIIVSRDSGDYHVTHTESNSGSSDLTNVVLWYSFESNADYNTGEGKLYAYRVDGENDTIKIQWRATMFYGLEFWD